ncbi:hypothetical protein V1524DRAFT_218478 [Lipomyces starkeyi]
MRFVHILLSSRHYYILVCFCNPFVHANGAVQVSLTWPKILDSIFNCCLTTRYTSQCRPLRYLRLFFLIVIALLLITAMVLTMLITDAIKDTAYCAITYCKLVMSAGQTVQTLGTFLCLVIPYFQRVSDLIFGPAKPHKRSWLPLLVSKLGHDTTKLVGRSIARKRRPQPQRKRWDVVFFFTYWRYFYIQLATSFFWKILSMLFGVSLGITQLATIPMTVISG